MKRCLECGTFSSDDTVFCSVCGKRFSDAMDVSVTEDDKSENEKPRNDEQEITSTTHPEIVLLLQRVSLFLEDSEFDRADEYCERILDIDPKNGEAYLGKLMVELQVRRRQQLADCSKPFDDKENYAKILRFGDEILKAEIQGYIIHIKERNENARLTGIYNKAIEAMKVANTEEAFEAVAESFKTIPHFKDADDLARQCIDKADVCRKDDIYEIAMGQIDQNNLSGYESAFKILETIPGWRDADEKIDEFQRKIEEIRTKEEEERLKIIHKEEQQHIAFKKVSSLVTILFVAVTLIILIYIVWYILSHNVIMPNRKYNAAVKLIEKGDIINAYETLIALGGYKDSEEKANEIFDLYKIEKLKAPSVGDTVYFGSYEQDANTANGKEEIEWLVLAREDDRALLISKYALDCQQYDSYNKGAGWENCSLRVWLNETFVDQTFSADEQNCIISSVVTDDINPVWNTTTGNDTTDKIFLLSVDETNSFFDSNTARQCQGTAYCFVQGGYEYSNETCIWWLRTIGGDYDLAATVSSGGEISNYGDVVDDDIIAVRPALWINLGS